MNKNFDKLIKVTFFIFVISLLIILLGLGYMNLYLNNLESEEKHLTEDLGEF